jgi:hypothetical protein
MTSNTGRKAIAAIAEQTLMVSSKDNWLHRYHHMVISTRQPLNRASLAGIKSGWHQVWLV